MNKKVQSDVKIRRLFFLFMLSILAFAVILSNLTYALKDFAELHEKSLDEITKHSSSQQIPSILVGDGPISIGINPFTNTIYVANQDDGTVSVINGSSNTKIGNDIRVGVVLFGGSPSAIGVDFNTIYVAKDDGTVSVINGSSNTKIGNDIRVGGSPVAMGLNLGTSTIYVVNHDDGTVSVNGSSNTKNDIPVGRSPVAIGLNSDTSTIYVANHDDDTVSVIDGISNKLVAAITLNTQPFNAGRIECPKGSLPVPIAQQFYIPSHSRCTATANQGFEFTSWQENLGGNSTRILNFSQPSTWDSVLRDSVLDFFHMKSDKPEATLNITKFGSFTANFKELPPPIPSEYLLGLFTIVASTIVGWSIPTIISWTNSSRRAKLIFTYHQKIGSLGTIDQGDMTSLDQLYTDLGNDYSKGRITDKQYENMKNEISSFYEEIYRKRIQSWNQISDKVKTELNNLVIEIEDVYSKGKLNEVHYTMLNGRIAQYKSNRNVSAE